MNLRRKKPPYEQMVAEETLILDATEEICRQMERRGLGKTELGKRMGLSPARMTRFLDGSSNLTLRSVVRAAWALNCKVQIKIVKDTNR